MFFPFPSLSFDNKVANLFLVLLTMNYEDFRHIASVCTEQIRQSVDDFSALQIL
ncbi:hypothetical protein Syun_026420 [Stephania yunnanensis]|uniref:Uncharacterized protein n=1 Tax=Stephania yunnanensis TaxID=152371 RepID=A0AAP0HX02_9MAGN